jgi:pyruvate formate lyase activating enzyme
VSSVTSPPRGQVADVVRRSVVDGPGNRYVLFLQGCGFDCVTCHNPQTRPQRSTRARSMTVPEVLADVAPVAPFLSGITVSGGEATGQAAFLAALFAGLRDDAGLASLTRFVDSNGDAPATVWDDLAPLMHGAMIDLKALDPDAHVRLTGTSNARVLASLHQLSALGLLYEVRLLLVPGANDDPQTLRRTAEWLLALPAVPRVKVIGFRRHGTRAPAHAIPEPDATARAAYADVLAGAGLPVAEVV